MGYIIIKKEWEKRGATTRAIAYHIVTGRISSTVKMENLWIRPPFAPKPADLRKNNRRHLKKECGA